MDQGDDDGIKSEYPADLKCYDIVEIIGGGMSSLVCKALCIPMNSCEVAIKVIHFEESADAEEVANEAKKMASLVTHPNILKPHCIFTFKTLLWVVMPFFPGGSLQNVLDSDHVGLPEACIAPILKEVSSALCCLHEHGHLHGDVKPSNIFVDSDGSVKLADLGLSDSFYTIGVAFKTPSYSLAPEEIHSSNTIDIWYVGNCALKLAHGSADVSTVESPDTMDMRVNHVFGIAEYYQKIEVGSSTKCMESSSCFKDMVVFCLDVLEPSKRPTADELLKHDFFKNCKGPDFLIKNVVKKKTSDADEMKLIQEDQTQPAEASINKRFEEAKFFQKVDMGSSSKKTIFSNSLEKLVRLKQEFLMNNDEQKISSGDGKKEEAVVQESVSVDNLSPSSSDGEDKKEEGVMQKSVSVDDLNPSSSDGDDKKEQGVMQKSVSVDNLNSSSSDEDEKKEEGVIQETVSADNLSLSSSDGDDKKEKGVMQETVSVDNLNPSSSDVDNLNPSSSDVDNLSPASSDGDDKKEEGVKQESVSDGDDKKEEGVKLKQGDCACGQCESFQV